MTGGEKRELLYLISKLNEVNEVKDYAGHIGIKRAELNEDSALVLLSNFRDDMRAQMKHEILTKVEEL